MLIWWGKGGFRSKIRPSENQDVRRIHDLLNTPFTVSTSRMGWSDMERNLTRVLRVLHRKVLPIIRNTDPVVIVVLNTPGSNCLLANQIWASMLHDVI